MVTCGSERVNSLPSIKVGSPLTGYTTLNCKQTFEKTIGVINDRAAIPNTGLWRDVLNLNPQDPY